MSTIMIEQELKAIKEFITRQALQQKDILTLREAALYAGILESPVSLTRHFRFSLTRKPADYQSI